MSEKLEPTILNESMFSAGASPVRTSAQPGSKQGWTERSQGCGQSSPDSLASYDRDTQLWRTSQRSLLGGWEPFSETWPRSGMMRSGTAYRLRSSVPPSQDREETECLLWPSPTATDACGRGYHGSLKGNWWAALPGAIALSLGYPVQHPVTGKINPEFVEWLMGFEIGHTESDASGTQ